MSSSSSNVPTVQDLRVKLCYICREEEHHDQSESPPREWIHPCNCTLVAHERCLLKWIETSQADASREPNALKCPQCGAEYEIESDNPLTLKVMEAINNFLSRIGKKVTIISIAVVAGAFGTGIYVLSVAYGAYATRKFLGKEMYDLVLTDDPSNWPWHAYLNLPLVTFGLLLTQTPLEVSSLPWLLVSWLSTGPVDSQQNRINNYWADPDRSLRVPSFPRSGLFPWPPPPLLIGTIVFPIVRNIYCAYKARLRHWLLSTQPARRNLPARRFEWAFDLLRIGLEVQDDGPRRRRQAGANNNNNNNNAGGAAPGAAEDPDNEDEDEPGRTVTISTGSVGRSIATALLIPDIASLMGSLLYRLSRHSYLLRRFLAVRPPLNGRMPFPPLGKYVLNPGMWETGSVLGNLLRGAKVGFHTVWGGSLTWMQCDPVWWRNSLGLGLFTVIKDAVQLLHLYLKKRELESRHVKNRSFAGIDLSELDLITPLRWQTQ